MLLLIRSGPCPRFWWRAVVDQERALPPLLVESPLAFIYGGERVVAGKGVEPLT